MSAERVLAEEIIGLYPLATKNELAEQMCRRLERASDIDLRNFMRKQTVKALSSYMATVQADLSAEKAPTISYGGRPMTASLAVDGRMTLWTECSPRKFAEAVAREKAVVDGRLRSNRVRRAFVDHLQAHPEIMDLPTLAEAVEAAGWDVGALDLDTLEAAS